MGTDALFHTQVINAIKNVDTDRIPMPFPLADAGKILSPGTNVQIFISTPKDPNTGAFPLCG